MSNSKHLATYPLYGGFTGKRVGTGYIYTPDDYDRAKPSSVRWRNDECRKEFMRLRAEREAKAGTS